MYMFCFFLHIYWILRKLVLFVLCWNLIFEYSANIILEYSAIKKLLNLFHYLPANCYHSPQYVTDRAVKWIGGYSWSSEKSPISEWNSPTLSYIDIWMVVVVIIQWELKITAMKQDVSRFIHTCANRACRREPKTS